MGTSREFVVIELEKSRRTDISVFQQLASETDDSGPRLVRQSLDERDEQELLASDRYVCHAPAMPLRLIDPVSEPARAQQASLDSVTWGIRAIGADQSEYQGDNTSVAVLDSGIDLEHDAFRTIANRILVKDYTGRGAGDPNGHGTHCAATIFGQDVDGIRVGVARHVSRVFVGRVLDEQGSGTSIALFEAIQAAINWKAQVISMSVGFDFPGMVETLVRDQQLPAKLAAARALSDFLANVRLFDTLAKLARDMVPMTGGSIIVAAAGNESRPAYRLPLSQPANADGVIAVGAVEPTEEGLKVATFSNTGPALCGPGVNVLSALPTTLSEQKLHTMDGTSMATPHVAGVAALWFQAQRERGELAISTVVADAVRSRATSKGFAPGTALNDRGTGLVRAP